MVSERYLVVSLRETPLFSLCVVNCPFWFFRVYGFLRSDWFGELQTQIEPFLFGFGIKF